MFPIRLMGLCVRRMERTPASIRTIHWRPIRPRSTKVAPRRDIIKKRIPGRRTGFCERREIPAGELRGYNIFAGGSGGNCVDFEHTANPYRSYGPVAAGCGNWIILRQAQDEALMVGLSNHDGAQFDPSSQENLYLDQQNETFLCAANCYFTSSWNSGCI